MLNKKLSKTSQKISHILIGKQLANRSNRKPTNLKPNEIEVV